MRHSASAPHSGALDLSYYPPDPLLICRRSRVTTLRYVGAHAIMTLASPCLFARENSEQENFRCMFATSIFTRHKTDLRLTSLLALNLTRLLLLCNGW